MKEKKVKLPVTCGGVRPVETDAEEKKRPGRKTGEKTAARDCEGENIFPIELHEKDVRERKD